MTPARREAHAVLDELHRIGGRVRLDGEKVMVDWHGKRSAALAERLRAVKPELRAMLTPLATVDELAATAARLFNGKVENVK